MLIDANVFLEVMLGQAEHSACRSVLDRVRAGDLAATVTPYHVDAVAYILDEARGDPAVVRTFLASLLVYDGLSVRYQPLTAKVDACQIMVDEDLDFDDAVAVRAAREDDGRIVTLDEDFDGVEGVERLPPAAV